MEDEMERRSFIKGGLATLGLGVLSGPATSLAQNPTETRIQRYVPLGRTGMRISDISFGSSRTSDPAVVRHAFEKGINYFDTAEGYKDGKSEEAIGQALEGVRDQVYLASKVKCMPNTTRSELMRSLETSLKRLRTDYVDVYFNHAVNDVERLKNDAWYEFVDRAKAQGKLRFTGMSGHSGRLGECLDYAISHESVDVVLVAYNYGQDPGFFQGMLKDLDLISVQPNLLSTLAKAHEKGIGVIAMKTLRGARRHDISAFEKPGRSFPQAAFGWVLSNPDVDALIVSMTSDQEIDEYVQASGSRTPRGARLELLERHWASTQSDYCDHGCETCHTACPHGVAVNEVLRTRMYATHYGDLDYARDDYAKLGSGASLCTNCTQESCINQCPNGLDLPSLTRSAHRILS
ncbi:MAG: aldo/keto reductase [Myxococcota bacterium]|nr:aldo/keto reductase [Myxococcota bacterium]